ncbi:RtcB family protein [bacterium]|nr:RtcB family protein [candidate division CSSED10-310 bacterium]
MKESVQKVDAYRWLLPREAGMNVDGLIYADDAIIAAAAEDGSLRQVKNSATLPGVVGYALAMPDIHYGYGLPIGGVLASDVHTGVISPGGVGFDINCGVRMVRTGLTLPEVTPKLDLLLTEVAALIPHGVGSRGRISLGAGELDEVMVQGAGWAVSRGYGTETDLRRTEESGCFQGADPGSISREARTRGINQQGTLGSGNHFIEFQVIEEIFDDVAAAAYGLTAGAVAVMIHSGSRGFGHQVCADALQDMTRAARRHGIVLADRQLACAPVQSPEGRRYLGQMKCAANYAWSNRQCMTHLLRRAITKIFAATERQLGLELVYDVAHNIVKIERHSFQGRPVEVAVHRKGATRAFGPGREELPVEYRAVGQPVLVPGDMGRASYVLAGTKTAMEQTFGSTCHGAGRVLSRAAAVRSVRGGAVEREIARYGVIAKAATKRTLLEELPHAYKDVSKVVAVVHGAGISRLVARLRPLGVVKG